MSDNSVIDARSMTIHPHTVVEHFEMRRTKHDVRLYWRKPTMWAVRKGQRAGTVNRQGKRIVQFKGKKYTEDGLIDALIWM